MTTSSSERLNAIVRDFLNGKLTYSLFATAYLDAYLAASDIHAAADEDWRYYDAISAALEMTSDRPTEPDREARVQSAEEFTRWLREFSESRQI